ncbi:glycosyltransferase [Trichocoleus sp. FACHB-90]|uniref:glycosyltransferase family 39 protein n=1 Tax=Cyanophyceae TaxID=3028117 RepID=UPI001684BC06|nr:glycosyltransferase [Trichocoleus sp. FACHB-90]MBD1928306.1 glycosyltransferase [Trichocoleus sp. FACHB-90]
MSSNSIKIQNSKFPLLLLLWIGIGTGLRLMNLALKSPWTDEFSTLTFSLGNSFTVVPLDQAIALDTLVQPLIPNPAAGIGDVIHHLLTESNHPPLYFVLTHLWLQLFPAAVNGGMEGLVSLWGARSLAVLLGVASIPAVYALARFAFRSQLVGQMAAAMMAVSPYGIFLAQEARHYTLAMLWVIASLGCLVVAVRHIQRQKPLPIWLVLVWVGVNTLGIASHYFFALTLCAEAVALIVMLWGGMNRRGTENAEEREKIEGMKQASVEKGDLFTPRFLLPILAVAAGTLAGGLVWVPVFLQNSYGGKLTEWIQGDRVGLAWLSPVFQAIAAWITMISLLPVEASQLPLVIASVVAMVIFFFWALPILYRGLKVQRQRHQNTWLFEAFVWSAIALFFIFTYFLGIDLTRGARYNFVYFPAVIVVVGASLAACWEDKGKTAVVLVWLMGLLSGITVVSNLGYQKYYRPDLLAPIIQQNSQAPVLIATTRKTHVQNGEMMGIAWEFKRQGLPQNPQFLLAHQDKNPKTSTIALQKTLATLPRPLDLWLVNFHAPIELNGCVENPLSSPAVDGYDYKLYRCQK